MPSLKAIRNRIASVKNTRKITKAMKLVAAAKLRRSQDAIIAARPYSAGLANVVSELSRAVGNEVAHELFEQRPVKAAAIVVVSADRGLAGAFNSNVIKAVERYVVGELPSANVSLRLIGKKANQHFTRRKATIASYDLAPTSQTALQTARETATRIIADFTAGKVDRVILVYNEFKNAGTQVVRVAQLLPVVADSTAGAPTTPPEDYLYEPSKAELLSRLVPLYVQNQIYRASLESIASFFGAQMMAMENATKSAGEMIERYTLQYNRARQASITKELAEIVGGAEALKG